MYLSNFQTCVRLGVKPWNSWFLCMSFRHYKHWKIMMKYLQLSFALKREPHIIFFLRIPNSTFSHRISPHVAESLSMSFYHLHLLFFSSLYESYTQDMLESTNSDPDFWKYCHWWRVLGVLVRPGNQIPVVNENPTGSLNTTSLKCCMPSTDAIDRWKKNSRVPIRVQGRLMQAHFIDIH